MKFTGTSPLGRIATRFASLSTPPYYGRLHLARLNPKGYISPRARIHHPTLSLGSNIYIDDGTLIFQDKDGGAVELGDAVHLHRDTIIQTGAGGNVSIGSRTTIQPRCQFSAYKAPIRIGQDVQIAPNCSFYPYSHGVAPDELIINQPLNTKGGIYVDDDVWFGVGVIVLDGVKIGRGAVIGAGSVVSRNVPAGGIAVGTPARVVKMRNLL